MANYDMLGISLGATGVPEWRQWQAPPCRNRNHVHTADWRDMLVVVRHRGRSVSALSHHRTRIPTVSQAVHARSRLASVASTHVSFSSPLLSPPQLTDIWLQIAFAVILADCRVRLMVLGGCISSEELCACLIASRFVCLVLIAFSTFLGRASFGHRS